MYSPNAANPLSVYLVDPVTGLPYRVSNAPVATPAKPSPNSAAPISVLPVDVNTGVPVYG